MGKIVSIHIILHLLTYLFGAAQLPDSLSVPVYYQEDSSEISLIRLKLNSDQSDMSPQLVNGHLIFASGRPNDLAVNYHNALNTEVTDLFIAARKDSLRFSTAKSLSSEINSPYNEGPFVFSPDGNTIWFSSNPREKDAERSGGASQIYTATRREKDRWSSPVRAPFSDPAFSNFHPALSADGTWLIFASDRPGGFGGADLYSTQLVNGQWGAPVNLGPAINSPANELFPYLSQGGRLYFSSNRTGGPGGLDVYSIAADNLKVGTPVILPVPLNSAADDFGICTETDENSGYLTSNRHPKHGDDIFYFSKYPDFSNAKAPPRKTKFCYTFYEAGEYLDNDSVSMTYEWDFGNGNKFRGERVKYCFDRPGDYPVHLNIVEKNSGLVFNNKVSYTITVEEPAGLRIDCPDTLVQGSEFIVSTAASRLKGYELQSFYWSFGDGRYNRGLQARHIYRRSGICTIRLGVKAKNAETKKIEKFRVEKNVIIRDTI